MRNMFEVCFKYEWNKKLVESVIFCSYTYMYQLLNKIFRKLKNKERCE